MPNRQGIAPLVAMLTAVMAMVPAVVAAAPSPSPSGAPGASAEPSVPPHDGPSLVEAWLDRPIPSDAAPGTRIDIGAVLWDPRSSIVVSTGTAIFIRVHAAGSDARPIDTSARQNWRGHYFGTIEVPAAGLGLVELGVPGTTCDDSGCVASDWLFPVAGTGPPPDAPVTGLATAAIDPLGAPLVAGQAIDLMVRLRPNAGLDPDLFTMPGSLVIRAHPPRGPNLATATLTLATGAPGAEAGEYHGSLTIPEGGDMVLEAAIDADGGDETRFGTSLTRVMVEPAASAPITGAGDVPWLAIAAVLLALGATVILGPRLAGRRRGR